ncbi:hypothetical protein H206_02291 [Candidatus Electrothrix aarhusensis]|uniref:Uncharacterized protein n=1 Tax=Candidatus Electrothrix aarhusensis TaxID=1859131 RepID=A0A444J1E7_9BACT|nr:hypothetical protein H206_02291 [Candidatus Electrothrix aarhusensis]
MLNTMNQSPPGRMLGGIGILLGPPQNTQFQMVVKVIKTILPKFAASAIKEGIENENGLNSKLTRFITNTADQENFFANREPMENETRGDSPAVDIGIYLNVNDTGIDPPLITVFEGKRLTTTKLPKKRRREYVIGRDEKGKHVPCGGIERFKLGIHGKKLHHAGMIGYIQDETAEVWHEKINSWISELCQQPSKRAWSEQEQLTPKKNNGQLAEYSSVVKRTDSELHMTHLWISLL